MCCSREHYPTDTGVWKTDGVAFHVHYDGGVHINTNHTWNFEYYNPKDHTEDDDHYHVVLPSGLTVCIRAQAHGYYKTTLVVKRESRGVQFSCSFTQALMKGTFANAIALRDILALAVVEGAALTGANIGSLVTEWHEERGLYMPHMHWEGAGIPNAEPLGYHEWLVLQAKAELGRDISTLPKEYSIESVPAD